MKHDPWATFMGFSRKWREAERQAEGLEADLPIIWEAGEQPPTENGVAQRIASRLTRALDDVLGGGDSDSGKIAKMVENVVGETVAEDRQSLNIIQAEFADLTARSTQLRTELWIAIGLLFAILLAHLFVGVQQIFGFVLPRAGDPHFQ